MWNESKLPSGARTDQEQLNANFSMKSTKQRNQPKQASSDTKKTLNTQGKAMKSTRLWASWEHLSVLLQLLLFEQYKKNKLTARHHISRGFS